MCKFSRQSRGKNDIIMVLRHVTNMWIENTFWRARRTKLLRLSEYNKLEPIVPFPQQHDNNYRDPVSGAEKIRPGARPIMNPGNYGGSRFCIAANWLNFTRRLHVICKLPLSISCLWFSRLFGAIVLFAFDARTLMETRHEINSKRLLLHNKWRLISYNYERE